LPREDGARIPATDLTRAVQWTRGSKATLWLKNEGYPSKRIKQLGSLAEAVQAQESRRRTRERTCFIYMHPTNRMSKEDGRLTGGRFQFASDPVAFEVKYATTTYTKEVALTFRAGPVCGGGWGTANARRAIVREVFMVD